MKFQEFSVIKVNKFGVRQERTMGIDDKFLTNNVPENKVTKSNDKVKRPKRSLSELQKVWLNANRPNEFILKFKDQTYKYESQQSEEIVAKLSFLLKLADEGKKSNN